MRWVVTAGEALLPAAFFSFPSGKALGRSRRSPYARLPSLSPARDLLYPWFLDPGLHRLRKAAEAELGM